MTELSPAAQAALDAYMDENCGDELMASERRGMAAAFLAVALYLKNDCQQLLAVAAELADTSNTSEETSTMTDYKQLCAELYSIFEKYDDDSNLGGIYRDMEADGIDILDRARAALAEPEPVGPTEEELYDLAE